MEEEENLRESSTGYKDLPWGASLECILHFSKRWWQVATEGSRGQEGRSSLFFVPVKTVLLNSIHFSIGSITNQAHEYTSLSIITSYIIPTLLMSCGNKDNVSTRTFMNRETLAGFVSQQGMVWTVTHFVLHVVHPPSLIFMNFQTSHVASAEKKIATSIS